MFRNLQQQEQCWSDGVVPGRMFAVTHSRVAACRRRRQAAFKCAWVQQLAFHIVLFLTPQPATAGAMCLGDGVVSFRPSAVTDN